MSQYKILCQAFNHWIFNLIFSLTLFIFFCNMYFLFCWKKFYVIKSTYDVMIRNDVMWMKPSHLWHTLKIFLNIFMWGLDTHKMIIICAVLHFSLKKYYEWVFFFCRWEKEHKWQKNVKMTDRAVVFVIYKIIKKMNIKNITKKLA